MKGRRQSSDLGDYRIVWRIRVGNRTISWDAEVTEDVPNESIAWQSISGTFHPNAGRVTFEQTSDHQTRIRVSLKFGAARSPFATAAKEAGLACVQWSLNKFRTSLSLSHQ